MLDRSGILEKWTNYWLGWQPRYFSLENGILSYYQSEDEVVSGAKAAIRVASADVLVHPTDNRRFDVSLGNGQRFSIRARTQAERQSWIIALATTKQKSNEIGGLKLNIKKIDKAEKVNRKSTELKLFCDLLNQQVVSLLAVTGGEPLDQDLLNEQAKMLSATCKTFLKTLNDTMSMFEDVKADNISSPTMSPKINRKGIRRTFSTASLPTGLQSPPNAPLKPDKTHRRTNSSNVHFTLPDRSSSPIYPDTRSLHSFHGAIDEFDGDIPKSRKTPDTLSLDLSKVNLDIEATLTPDEFESPVEEFPDEERSESTPTPPKEATPTPTMEEDKMFFNQVQHSFVNVSFVQRADEFEVPIDSFLLAAADLLPILDKLGSKAFAPVKMDINGNICKIRKKFDTDSDHFNTLQDIVRQELNTGTTKVSNSATDAIMWLKRALAFVAQFLQNIVDGETNLTLALQKGYSSTLSHHHNWVVKGVFALAVKAAPCYDDFIRALANETTDINSELFKASLQSSLLNYTSSLQTQLDNLHTFYLTNNLESNKLV